MKLQIFAVAQNTPPVGEEVFLVHFDDPENPGCISNMSKVKAEISVCESDDIEYYRSKGIHTNLGWNNGNDMYLDDYWCYTAVSKGE